jgi:hypothetical protein
MDRNGSVAVLLSRMHKFWLVIMLVGVITLAVALAAAMMVFL